MGKDKHEIAEKSKGDHAGDGDKHWVAAAAQEAWTHKGDHPKPQEHDYNANFDLKLGKNTKIPDHGQLYKDHPDLTKRIITLAGDPVTDGQDTFSYKHTALLKMVAKYGPEKVDQMLTVIEEGQPKQKLSKFTISIGDDHEKLNHSLYNMSDLIAANKGETLSSAIKQLREDGYTKTLPMGDLRPEYVDLLANKPEERQALKEFEQNPDWAAIRRFLNANEQYLYHDKYKPTDVLKAFKAFQASEKQESHD